MSINIIIIIALITILSLVLMLVTFLSYSKFKNKKLLFVGCVFLFFFLRSLLLSFSIFIKEIETFTNSGYIWLFDLIILVLLYAAYSVKR